MKRYLTKFYQTLLENESIPFSSLNLNSLKEFERLHMLGAVKKTVSGRGIRVELCNRGLVESEVKRIFPDGIHATFKQIETRHQSVRTFGDAKPNSVRYPTIQLRIYNPSKIKHQEEPVVPNGIDWSYVSSIAILERSLEKIRVEGGLVLVENHESFLHSASVFPDKTAVMWYSGRLKRELISWLKLNVDEILVCADYDPVGLQEYLILRESLSEKIRLFVPDNLDDLFKYSEAVRYEDNKQYMSYILASDLHDEQSLQVLRLIQEHQSGLDQEIAFPKPMNEIE